MNDQSAGWSPDSGDDDYEGEGFRHRSAVQRTLMDRALRAAEKDRQKAPRRWLQHGLAFAAALAAVLVLALGFDAFLTSVQRVLRMVGAEEAAAPPAQTQPLEPAAPADPAAPMPAYVVPEGD